MQATVLDLAFRCPDPPPRSQDLCRQEPAAWTSHALCVANIDSKFLPTSLRFCHARCVTKLDTQFLPTRFRFGHALCFANIDSQFQPTSFRFGHALCVAKIDSQFNAWGAPGRCLEWVWNSCGLLRAPGEFLETPGAARSLKHLQSVCPVGLGQGIRG